MIAEASEEANILRIGVGSISVQSRYYDLVRVGAQSEHFSNSNRSIK